MQNSKSEPNPPITEQQKLILRQVSALFKENDGSKYISHINELIGMGLQHVGDPDYIGKVVYSVTRVVSFIATLSELTQYQREELLQGGMSELDVARRY